jgi:hypothetical protein
LSILELKILIEEKTSLEATMVRWFEGGMNQGLLPMTINEEESYLFCACHLLNFDEGHCAVNNAAGTGPYSTNGNGHR